MRNFTKKYFSAKTTRKIPLTQKKPPRKSERLSPYLFAFVILGYGVVAGAKVPTRALCDSLPLRLCAAILYARKVRAIRERPIAYACHAVGDHYAGKARATPERIIAYTCHSVADYYARKVCSTIERRRSYTFHAVADYYTRNVIALIERKLINLISLAVIIIG